MNKIHMQIYIQSNLNSKINKNKFNLIQLSNNHNLKNIFNSYEKEREDFKIFLTFSLYFFISSFYLLIKLFK